jgi:heavy metal-binding protein
MRHRLRFSSSTAVLAGRLVLVAVAAAASVTGFVIWHRDASPTSARASSPVRYVCPMHAEVVSGSPGDCPICRMALVPKSTAEPVPGQTAEAHAPPATLTLPPGVQLRGYDTRSKVQQFESAFEMRVPAAADGARTGVALFHLDESELIRPGEEGWFSPSSGPRGGAPLGLKVHVLSLPFERWDASTVLVHFEAEAGAELVANETGLLKLATRLRHGLVAPESAIIDSPEGPYVLIAEADRKRVTKRPVEIGTRLYGFGAVVSGLHDKEYVAAKHAFVLDVERRGQAGRTVAP